MSVVNYSKLRALIEAEYTPRSVRRARSKKTCALVRQVLGEISAIPGFPVTRPSHLRSGMVNAWLDAWPDRSPATADKLLRSLSAALLWAQAEEYIKTTPFDAIPARKWLEVAEPPSYKFHSRAAIGRVLDVLALEAAHGFRQHRLYALVATVAYTALRRDEALHLLVCDVDFDHRVIVVSTRRKRKTRKSAQPVAMPPALVPILRDWFLRLKQEPDGLDGSAPVFRTRPCARWPRSVAWTSGAAGTKPLDELKALGVRLGVYGLTFQSLRHSWATHAALAWKLGQQAIKRGMRHTILRTQESYIGHDYEDLAQIGNAIEYPRLATFEQRNGVS